MTFYGRRPPRPTTSPRRISIRTSSPQERRGDIRRHIQVIRPVTNAIKDFLLDSNDEYDFVLCEIGGPGGDTGVAVLRGGSAQIKNDRPRDQTPPSNSLTFAAGHPERRRVEDQSRPSIREGTALVGHQRNLRAARPANPKDERSS